MLLRGFGAGVGVALVTMLVAGLSYYSSTPEGREGGGSAACIHMGCWQCAHIVRAVTGGGSPPHSSDRARNDNDAQAGAGAVPLPLRQVLL